MPPQGSSSETVAEYGVTHAGARRRRGARYGSHRAPVRPVPGAPADVDRCEMRLVRLRKPARPMNGSLF
ncbi:hypothetical protein GCM10009578_053150 [Streptomyces rhizosphaericus]